MSRHKKWLLIGIVTALMFAGCMRQKKTASNSSAKDKRGGPKMGDSQIHLERALKLLKRSHEFDRTMDFFSRMSLDSRRSHGREQMLFHLSFWGSLQSQDDKWLPDPLVERLPGRLRNLRLLRDLKLIRFTTWDIQFLEEAMWHRNVARWVSRQEPDERLKGWQKESGLSGEDFNKLLVAERLFDWTVRNVQLDPLPSVSPLDPNYKPPRGMDIRLLKGNMSPALQGLSGPGYMQQPWETLLFGHGDAWMRGRTFIYLARQMGIDAVMLAVRRGDDETPWAVGVLLDNKAYVFDPRLGLPLPTPDHKGICHLKQLIDNPKLLDELKQDDFEYLVKAEDLKTIGALMDAAPNYLTQKFFVLQKKLTGENQMVLSYSPRQTAQTLNATPGIRWNRIWDVPFDCVVYVDGRANKEQGSMARSLPIASLVYQSPLIEGRLLHLAGRFDTHEQGAETIKGALALYLEVRYPEATIQGIATDQEVQELVGLKRMPEEPDASWFQRRQRTELLYRQAKVNSSYWVGLIHYDTGAYESAKTWFESRGKKADSKKSPWLDGTRYNLGRTLEALKDYDGARKLYEKDYSPQRYGNLLRAKWLPTTGSNSATPPKTEARKTNDRKKAEAAKKKATAKNKTTAKKPSADTKKNADKKAADKKAAPKQAGDKKAAPKQAGDKKAAKSKDGKADAKESSK